MVRTLALLLAHFSMSAATTDLPPGLPLLPGDVYDQLAASHAGGDVGAVQVLPGDGDTPQMLRVDTVRDASPLWAIELQVPTQAAVERGGSALLQLRLRARSTQNESGKGHVWVEVSPGVFSPAAAYDMLLGAGTEWQSFDLPFEFRQDHPAGSIALRLFFGFRVQSVELADIRLTYFGQDVPQAALPRTRFTYEGREPDAQWRKDALARIETVRKGRFEIHVTGSDGQPATGATVQLRQVRSSFGFGTAVSLSWLLSDKPESARYRELLLELFNSSSPENDLKWPFWRGERPGYGRSQALRGLRWLREHDLHVRGHVLVWPGWSNLPTLVRDIHAAGRTENIPQVVMSHIRDISIATRGLVTEWDVLNEPYTNHDLMDIFGREIMVDWFQEAGRLNPGVVLYLNDFSNHNEVLDADHVAHFESTARFLLEKGAPLDGLGLQGHFGAEPDAPEQLLRTLDRYAALDLPIRFTEFDVWTDDEELQADFTRDFLILTYSHPSVVGVQFWGFWAGRHWRPQAALYRKDWSPRPAAAAYRQLVLDEWRTRITGTTDSSGLYTGLGFQGDYELTVTQDGETLKKTFQITPGVDVTNVEVHLPSITSSPGT